MSINKLKSDMLELIELSSQIAMYNQMLLHHNDISDKRNYDSKKCNNIIKKVQKLQGRYFELKYKWFD